MVSSTFRITVRPYQQLYFSKMFCLAATFFIDLQMLSPGNLKSFSDTTNNSIFVKLSAQQQAFCCSLDVVSNKEQNHSQPIPSFFVVLYMLTPVNLISFSDTTNNSIFPIFSASSGKVFVVLQMLPPVVNLESFSGTTNNSIFSKKTLPSGKIFIALQMLSPVNLESYLIRHDQQLFFLNFSAQREGFCFYLDVVFSKLRITLRSFQ